MGSGESITWSIVVITTNNLDKSFLKISIHYNLTFLCGYDVHILIVGTLEGST